MTFSWNELVAIGVANFLHDPELVIHFLKILEPMRRDFLEVAAREFHSSMRTTNYGLPFDRGMWRRYCVLMCSLKYFQPNFIREPCWLDRPVADIAPVSVWPVIYIDQCLSDKIVTVNLLLDDRHVGRKFRGKWSKKEVEEALCDFEIWDMGESDEVRDEPYIISYGSLHEGVDIIN